MANEKDYTLLLDKIDEKLGNAEGINKNDIAEIKQLAEAIEQKITENQSKENFEAIKEKLEFISSSVGTTDLSSLQELKHDLTALIDNNENIINSLEKIQNIQNMSMTSAEFEEFQRQQLDLALKSNDDIFSKLTEIQENTKAFKRLDGVEKVSQDLEKIHEKMVSQISELLKDFKVQKLSAAENAQHLQQTGNLPPETLEIQYKSIRQTHKYVKELKENLETLKNKDLSAQLAKIDEIYENMLSVETWTEEMNLLNSTFENMISKVTKNINVGELSEKIDSLNEEVVNLSDWTDKIDYIAKQLDKIQKNGLGGALSDESAEKITSLIAKVKGNALNSDFVNSPEFEELSSKVDIIYESLNALNVWAGKLDNIQNEISGLKSSAGVVYSEPSSYTPVSDIDSAEFEEFKQNNSQLAEKIDTIIENVNILNDRLSEIDVAEQLKNRVDSKFDEANSEITQKIDEISRNINNFNEEINNVNIVAKVSEQIDESLSIVNNEISRKVESITEVIESLNNEIANINIRDAVKNDINVKFDEIITGLNAKIDEVCANFDRASGHEDFQAINDYLTEIKNELLTGVDNLQNSVVQVNASVIERLKDDINLGLDAKFENLQAILPQDSSGFLADIKEDINSKINEISTDLNSKFADLQNAIPQDNTAVIDDLKYTVESKFNEVHLDLSAKIADLQGLIPQDNSLIVDNLRNEINSNIAAIINDISLKFENLQTLLPKDHSEEIEGLKDSVERIVSDVSIDLNSKLENLQNAIPQDNSAILEQLKDNIEARFGEIGLDLVSRFENLQSTIPNDNTTLIEDLKEEISSQISELANSVAEMAASISTDIKPEISNFVDRIRDMFNSGISEVTVNSANNFERIISSINEVKEDISKFDFISQVTDTLNERFEEIAGSLSSNIEEINKAFGEINTLFTDTLSESTENTSRDLANLLDEIKMLSSKAESSCENLTFVQEEIKTMSMDIDSISDKFNNTDFSLSEFKEDITVIVRDELTNFTDNINSLSDRLENSSKELVDKVQDMTGDIISLKEKAEDVLLNIDSLRDKVDTRSEKIDDNFEDISIKIEDLNNKIEETSENQFKKVKTEISEIKKKSDESSLDLKHVIHEIGTSNDYIDFLNSKVDTSSSDIVDVKEQLDDLSREFVNLTGTKENGVNNYLYTLFDVESDFIKIHKIINENTRDTGDNIRTIKNKVETINEDISSISKRTNKLIVNSDEANKKFKSHLNELTNAIEEMRDLRNSLEETMQITGIETKLNTLNETSENLSNAFSYLAQWIDSVGNSLNAIKNITDNFGDDTQKTLAKCYTEIISKLSELKEKNNSELEILLDNDDYYKEFSDKLELLSRKVDNVEQYETSNLKMLMSSEKMFVKLFDKLEALDDKNYLSKIIRKIENFEDKTLLVKLIQKIEKINKTNANTVLKQIAALDIPDADTVSVKTLEMFSPILEKQLKSFDELKKSMNMSALFEAQNKYISKLEAKIANLEEKLESTTKETVEMKQLCNQQIEATNNLKEVCDMHVKEINSLQASCDKQNQDTVKLFEAVAKKLAEMTKAQNDDFKTNAQKTDELNKKMEKILKYIEE